MFTKYLLKEEKGKLWRKEGDFPGGPVVKTPRFQCRGHGFDPWSGKFCMSLKKKKKSMAERRKGRKEGGREEGKPCKGQHLVMGRFMKGPPGKLHSGFSHRHTPAPRGSELLPAQGPRLFACPSHPSLAALVHRLTSSQPSFTPAIAA